MDRYARMSASGLKARPVARQKKEGWCSWYHYYGFEDEADIVSNAEMLAKAFPDHRGFVIQIDDGWNLPEKRRAAKLGRLAAGQKISRWDEPDRGHARVRRSTSCTTVLRTPMARSTWAMR